MVSKEYSHKLTNPKQQSFFDVDYKARQQRRWKVVSAITLICIFASLLITYSILVITGSEKLLIIFVIATVAPLIIAPITSWTIIGLMIKVQALEEAHRRQVTYDDLTGLLTRRAFLNQSETQLKHCVESGQAFSLALLDLDNFKRINDLHGHGGGDEALMAFAGILKAEIRASDIAGRLGGEEFAIVLPNSSVSDAKRVLERIRLTTQETETEYFDGAITYTVSAGLSEIKEESIASLSGLIKEADDALYQAKARGRNLVVVSEV